MYEMVRMGYWLVLPYTAVRQFPQLKLAPAGVIPQRERRPRPIIDYTFNLLNPQSLPVAPTPAMQFGHAFHRIIQSIVYANPRFGPPLMAKVDLADGYYRVPLSSSAALPLAVILPSDVSPTPLVGIPLSLPMGWRHSPPYFCAFTETGADLANQQLKANAHLPPHPLQGQTQTSPFPWSASYAPTAHLPIQHGLGQPPLATIDVYIDDYMALAQLPNASQVMRTLLHSIEQVFQEAPDTARRPIISLSKLQKGDAAWSCQKRVLGWDVDTEHMTLSLPPHRRDRLQTLLTALHKQKRVSRKKWHRTLGELRSMATALYSAKHLFSILQHALADQPGPRIRLTPLLHQALADWDHLAATTATHPVPLASLVPIAPTFVGATDASKAGMGGFWLPTTINTRSTPPIVWRAPFPTSISDRLASATNKGHLTNSDLELAALVTGSAVAAATPSSTRHALFCAVDNTPALAWTAKGSTTSTGPPAFLLRQLAQLCRSLDYSLTPAFTPGLTNSLADLCSRSFHLSDAAFLHLIQTKYPTQPSWSLARPPTALLSKMNSALLKQMQPLESQAHRTRHGNSGVPSAGNSAKMPTWSPPLTPSPSCKFSPAATGWESFLPATLKSELARWREPFVPLARRWPHWGTGIPACSHPAGSTYDYIDN